MRIRYVLNCAQRILHTPSDWQWQKWTEFVGTRCSERKKRSLKLQHMKLSVYQTRRKDSLTIVSGMWRLSGGNFDTSTMECVPVRIERESLQRRLWDDEFRWKKCIFNDSQKLFIKKSFVITEFLGNSDKSSKFGGNRSDVLERIVQFEDAHEPLT